MPELSAQQVDGLLDALLRNRFEPTIIDKFWEWGPIGDNWLGAWTFATQWEREYGIDRQRTLRLIVDRYRTPALVGTPYA